MAKLTPEKLLELQKRFDGKGFAYVERWKKAKAFLKCSERSAKTAVKKIEALPRLSKTPTPSRVMPAPKSLKARSRKPTSEIDPVQEILNNIDALESFRDECDHSPFRIDASDEIINMEKEFRDILRYVKKPTLEERIKKMVLIICDILKLPKDEKMIQEEVDRLKVFDIWENPETKFVFPEKVKASITAFIDVRDDEKETPINIRTRAIKKMNKALADTEYQKFEADAVVLAKLIHQRLFNIFDMANNSKGLVSGYFMSHQKDWINDVSRQKISEKCRRSGYTFASSFGWVLDGFEFDNDKSWWISRSQRTARGFIDYCKIWCHIANVVAESKFMTTENMQVEKLIFPNNHVITALSSNPDAIAGEGGKIGMDEFALHQNQEKLYDIAQPAIINGDRIEVISTHRGHGQYYKFVEDAKKNKKTKWTHHRCTILDAVENGLVDRVNLNNLRKKQKAQTKKQFLEDLKAGCRTEEAWLQEYMCEVADDHNALLSWGLISSCTHDPEKLYNNHDGGRNFGGMDIGRKKNPSSITKIERSAELFVVRYHAWLKQVSFAKQRKELYKQIEDCSRFAIEEGGLGIQLAEEATEKYGELRVKGVAIAGSKIREEIATLLFKLFEQGLIKIPDDDSLIYSLHSIKKEYKPAYTRYYADDEEEKGHADFFWSLGLACSAAGEDPGNIEASSFGKQDNDFDDDDDFDDNGIMF